MSAWREASIEELCVRVTSGGTPSRKHREYYTDATDGIPWVKSQELVGRTIRRTDEQISDAGLRGSSAKLLPPDTVLMAMYGANVGQLGYLGIEATVNQAICAMVTDPTVTDARFLYYALGEARQDLVGQAHGAAQQNLSQQLIKPYELRVPGLLTQRRIGRILGGIDDLIENNRRRVEVLEEMARAIYREWFVRFRFPGHENLELVESDLGPIPDGWEIASVGELSSAVTRGIAPKYADDGEWIVLNQKCIRDERVTLVPSRRQSKAVPEAKRVIYGDVLINSTGVGTLGRVAMYRGSVERLTVDSHVTIARPHGGELNPWFGLSLVAMKAKFERLGSGSTGQTELSRGDIGAQRLALPPSELRAPFADAAWPLLSEADALIANSEPLGCLRDVLLPKLVTGQIDVSSLDLDALIEGAVA